MYGHIKAYSAETGIGVVQGTNGDAIFLVDAAMSREWKVGERVTYQEGVRAVNLQLDESLIESEGRPR